jgi:acetyl-CoA synthetase
MGPLRPPPTAAERAWLSHVVSAPSGRSFSVDWQRYLDLAASQPGSLPLRVWWPRQGTGAALLARHVGVDDVDQLHRECSRDRPAFWRTSLALLGVHLSGPAMAPIGGRMTWFPEAAVDLVGSALGGAQDRVALVFASEFDEELETWTVCELRDLVERIAAGLLRHGLKRGDAVGLVMPMGPDCIAACLAIVGCGMVCVSVPEVLAASAMARRFSIGEVKLVLTAEHVMREGVEHPLRARVEVAAGGIPTITSGGGAWGDFLKDTTVVAGSHASGQSTHLLFSSGTTSEPKAIPWTHLTPLKAAVDAMLHLDVGAGDTLCWPTSIGWMMGPWLIWSGLLNRATIAVFDGSPKSGAFMRFVERARVTVLGVVPTLVASWRATGLSPWRGIRLFASTGEASNPEDQLWLSFCTGYRAPVIEYCGGTEIGGAYLTGTAALPGAPSMCSIPAFGLDFVILNEFAEEVGVGDVGELFLMPPSIGLSEAVLNADHDKVYYLGCPRIAGVKTLRRHGDLVRPLAGGLYRIEGRADDAMNLSGIKVSAVEVETVLLQHERVRECAAVAERTQKGSECLVGFIVPYGPAPAMEELNTLLREELGPHVRLARLKVVDSLPRTPSNKIMRRELRLGPDL